MRKKLTYSNVVSTLCLFLLLGGGAAFAANSLPKNSVGTKQIKNGAITGQKVAAGTITGANLNLATIGTVPAAVHALSADTAGSAAHADSAANAMHAVTADVARVAEKADIGAVDGLTVGCPDDTTLVRGICFDTTLSGPVVGVKNAADGCAAKGGFLPSALMLYSVRNTINLGTGVGKDRVFSDQYYANTSGVSYKTTTVDGTGTITEFPVEGEAKYLCAYSVVR